MDLVPGWDWQTEVLFSYVNVELAVLKEDAIFVYPGFLQLGSSV